MKNFAPPQTPFPGVRDGQNLISWRWTNPVWWGSIHTISSYRGNRPTHTHKHTYPPQPQTELITIHCSAASAQSNYKWWHLLRHTVAKTSKNWRREWQIPAMIHEKCHHKNCRQQHIRDKHAVQEPFYVLFCSWSDEYLCNWYLTCICCLHTTNNIINVNDVVKNLTRSSADADNGLDAFVGQSRSKNILGPFQVK